MMTTCESIHLLKQMLSIPSLSRNEESKASFLQAYLQQMGCEKVNRVGNNVYTYAYEYDAKKPTILLNSHIDTVKPNENWTYAPFQATQVGDSIYGLGANDAHASVVSLIAAFDYLRSTSQTYNLILGISCEEEVSGKNGVECMLQSLPAIDLAIVGEPTG